VNTTTNEQILCRIETKGIQAHDIKHKNRLTDEQIAGIPVNLIYQWVRTGEWKQKDFRRWLKVMCVID
jgi:hypothetical protein